VSRVLTDKLFVDAIGDLIGEGGPPRTLDLLATVQPVIIVGRPPRSTGAVERSFDTLVDANGRLLTTPFLSGDAVVELAPRALSLILDSGQVAGNAAISSLAVADGFTYEIWSFLYSYVAVGAASRTTIAMSVNSMHATANFATGMTNSLAGYTTASTLALTSGQDGSIALFPGGVESKNLNGTVTFVVDRLKLPIKTIGIPGISVGAATAGLASDFHRAVIVGRRTH
jgi:hypothetical protein